jgi:hypothetical protein
MPPSHPVYRRNVPSDGDSSFGVVEQRFRATHSSRDSAPQEGGTTWSSSPWNNPTAIGRAGLQAPPKAWGEPPAYSVTDANRSPASQASRWAM